jgi:uncharacterized protein (DUF2249 family)
MRAKVQLAPIAKFSRDVHNQIDKRRITALIDPGSDHSIIQFDHLPTAIQLEIKLFLENKIPNNHNIQLNKNAVVKTVNGESVADTMSITLQIKIGRWQGPINLIVLDELSNEKFIIGADFLRENEAVISLKENGDKLSLKRPSLIAFCRSTRSTIIPPNQEGHIEVVVPRNFNSNFVLVQSFDHSQQSFSIASSVNRVNNSKVHIRYINPTDKPIKIRKNQTLAEVSSLSDHVVAKEAPNERSDFESLLDQLKIDPNLDSDQRAQLIRLLNKHQTAFSRSPTDLGQTNIVEHDIRLTTDEPSKQPPYRVPPSKRVVIDQKVQEMKDQGVLEDSNSPFAAPVVLILKKNGEWRFCADYRKLNDITVKDAYPLPRIDDSLDALRANSYFTKLDLVSGFWQIQLSPEAREKTAIATPSGLYQFRVMPYGLTNSPATFQRLMDRVLSGLTWNRCIVYMDDIVVFGRTFEEHNKNLEFVLKRIIDANLKLNVKKCEFAADQIVYLGHRITKNGIGVDPSKVEAIDRIEIPTNRQKLRRFLGMATYYKRFIHHFSHVAAPLTALTSVKREFQLSNEAQLAFDQIKSLLKNAPLLAAPDFSKPFQLVTDASKKGLGAVLQQDGKPIAYASRTCTVAEQNYQATEQEALAVIWAVRHFKHYIYGREIEILTDHKPLHDLKSNRHPDEPLGRLMLKLQGLNHKIKYIRGQTNVVADLLSRDISNQNPSDPEIEMREPDLVINDNAIELFDIDWTTIQTNDPELARVIVALQNNRKHISRSEYRKYFGKLSLNQGLVCRGDRIVVPENARNEQIHRFHVAHGHESFDKLSKRLKTAFYWPKMDIDILDFVRRCDICQRAKFRPPNRPELGQIADPDFAKPLKFWSIDFQGPFKTSKNGNRYIIVASDYGSKWVEARATKDCSAVTTANFLLEQVILRHGPVDTIHTDQGANFESKLINELCRIYGIRKTRSSPYHPEGNGAVEIENRSIKELLRAYTCDNQTDWDTHIPLVINARNTTEHSATGFTPYEMVYARKPSILIENLPIIEIEPTSDYIARLAEARKQIEASARKHLKKELAKRKRAYEKRHKINCEPLKEGDQVMISNEATHSDLSKKLEPKYIGPYTVLKVNKHDCLVENADKSYRKAIHLSRVHRYLPQKVGKEPEKDPSPSNSKPASPNLKPLNSNSNPPKSILKQSRQISDQPTPNSNLPQTYITRFGRQTKKVRYKI